MDNTKSKHILNILSKYSEGKTSSEISSEWFLFGVFDSDNEDIYEKMKENSIIDFRKNKCVCGSNIKEHCLIENRINKKRLCLGNHCVTKVSNDLGIYSKGMINFLKRSEDCFLNNRIPKPNESMLKLGLDRNWLNEDDYDFALRHTKFYTKGILDKDLNLDDVVRLIMISGSILNNIKIESKDYIGEYLHKVVNESDNEKLKMEYYEEFKVSNPSTTKTKYELIYNDGNPKWIKYEKLKKCDECGLEEYCLIKNIFKSYGLVNTLECEEYTPKFIYCSEDKTKYCRYCFIEKTKPSNNHILYVRNNKLCWTKRFEGGKCRKCSRYVSSDEKITVFEYEGEKLICENCWYAKKIIGDKIWLSKMNYPCRCGRWNFQFKRVSDTYKKSCSNCRY